jgi:YD repeat-containing protein
MLLLLTVTYGQLNKPLEAPDITPALPNEAAFKKYIDNPVNHNTGIPQISIPLYTIQSGPLTVPVSLSYHAGGIKVDEIATSVGLGWVLNAGGMVSRSVRGNPDEAGQRGFIRTETTVSVIKNKLDENEFQSVQNIINDAATNKEYDFESDEYTFNFPGYSGRFYYSQEEKKFIMQPWRDDISIEQIYELDKNGEPSYLMGWIFTDPNGTRYYFGVKSKSSTRDDVIANTVEFDESFTHDLGSEPEAKPSMPLYNPRPDYASSWMLLKIESADKEHVIEFNYRKFENGEGAVSYTMLTGEVRKKRGRVFLQESNNGEQSLNKVNIAPETWFRTYINRRCFQNEISEIKFKHGSVTFNYQTDREDLQGGQTMDAVTINANQNGSTVVDKTYRFGYNYFESAGANVSIPEGIDESIEFRKKRLKLDYITEISSTNVKGQKWAFEYDTECDLPDRLSLARDLWGYYNASNNNSLIMPVVGGMKSLYEDITSDRSVNRYASKSWILKSVTNPMGGKTTYNYENNTVRKTHLDNELKEITKGIGFSNAPENLLPYPDGSIYSPDGEHMPFYIDTFKIEGDKMAIACIESEISNHLSEIQNEGGEGKPGGPAVAAIMDYMVKMNCIKLEGFYAGMESNFSHIIPHGWKNQCIELLPGTYTFNAFEHVETGHFAISGSVKEYHYPTGDITIESVLSGGLRVASIVSESDNNRIEKRYYYPWDGNAISNYNNLTTLDIGSGQFRFIYFCADSKSFSYKNSSVGNNIYYRKVIEELKDSCRNEYEYTWSSDLNSSGVVMLPSVDNGYQRGRLRYERQYQYKNGEYVKVREVENKYTYDYVNKRIKNLRYEAPILPLNNSGTGHQGAGELLGGNLNTYAIEFYNTKIANGWLSKSVERNFYDNDIVVTTSNYKYDNAKKFISKKEVTTDNSAPFTEMYYYLFDFENAGNESFNLEEKMENNIVSPVIKSLAYNNNVLIGGHVKRLNKFGQPLEMYMLKDKKGLDINHNIELILQPEYYDLKHEFGYANNSSRLEWRRSNGVETSYLWGYKNTLPILKADGVPYSNLKSAIESRGKTVEWINATVDTDEQAVNRHFNDLRDEFAKAQITTYNYKPNRGITRVTDANKNSTRYLYDTFGRLEFVLDNEDNILKSNSYHYAEEGVNISLTSNTGGTVTYDKSKVYYTGQPVTFTVQPDEYHVLEALYVNGNNVGNTLSYTLSSVNEGCNVKAQFIPNYYTVNINPASGGTVSPGGDVKIIRGQSKVFTITPNGSSKVKRVYVNNSVVIDNQATGGFNPAPFTNGTMQYTVSNMSSDINLNVEFEPKKYATKTEVIGMGNSNQQSPVSYLDHGSSYTWNFTDQEVATFVKLIVNGSMVVGNSYTANNIQQEMNIEVVYKVKPVTGNIADQIGRAIGGVKVEVFKRELALGGGISKVIKETVYTDASGNFTLTGSYPASYSHSDNQLYIQVSKANTSFAVSEQNLSTIRSYSFTGKVNYVSPTTVVVDEGGTIGQTKQLQANGNWTITEKTSWIKVSATSGTGNATITVTCDPNHSTESRNGYFLIKVGTDILRVNVAQKGIEIIVIPPGDEFENPILN